MAEQPPPANPTANLTAVYRARDLHAEGVWPWSTYARYGGVVFDGRDRVLLREPKNHYDGYHWTFPKGAPGPGEQPVDAALREVWEETGHRAAVVGHVPGAFSGGFTVSVNCFYLMHPTDEPVDEAAMEANGETWAVRWATRHEAGLLIARSTNAGGRRRDLDTLAAAYEAHQRIRA